MLLSASQAIPPVRAPSPMTATTARSGWPVSLYAREIPSAQDKDDEAWDDSTTSWIDSERCGYPAMPSLVLIDERSDLPVTSLCT